MHATMDDVLMSSLQENAVRVDDGVVVLETSAADNKREWVSNDLVTTNDILNIPSTGSSRSLPNSPRHGNARRRLESLVEHRHQWIHEELLLKTTAKQQGGGGGIITNVGSFSPRTHELVDKRHKWIEEEILTRKTMKQASTLFDEGVYHISKRMEEDADDDDRSQITADEGLLLLPVTASSSRESNESASVAKTAEDEGIKFGARGLFLEEKHVDAEANILSIEVEDSNNGAREEIAVFVGDVESPHGIDSIYQSTGENQNRPSKIDSASTVAEPLTPSPSSAMAGEAGFDGITGNDEGISRTKDPAPEKVKPDMDTSVEAEADVANRSTTSGTATLAYLEEVVVDKTTTGSENKSTSTQKAVSQQDKHCPDAAEVAILADDPTTTETTLKRVESVICDEITVTFDEIAFVSQQDEHCVYTLEEVVMSNRSIAPGGTFLSSEEVEGVDIADKEEIFSSEKQASQHDTDHAVVDVTANGSKTPEVAMVIRNVVTCNEAATEVDDITLTEDPVSGKVEKDMDTAGVAVVANCVTTLVATPAIRDKVVCDQIFGEEVKINQTKEPVSQQHDKHSMDTTELVIANGSTTLEAMLVKADEVEGVETAEIDGFTLAEEPVSQKQDSDKSGVADVNNRPTADGATLAMIEEIGCDISQQDKHDMDTSEVAEYDKTESTSAFRLATEFALDAAENTDEIAQKLDKTDIMLSCSDGADPTFAVVPDDPERLPSGKTEFEQTGKAEGAVPKTELNREEKNALPSYSTFDESEESNTHRLNEDDKRISVGQMDFLYTRKGAAVVEHAKRNAERFQKVKEDILMDDFVSGIVKPKNSGRSILMVEKASVTATDMTISVYERTDNRHKPTPGFGSSVSNNKSSGCNDPNYTAAKSKTTVSTETEDYDRSESTFAIGIATDIVLDQAEKGDDSETVFGSKTNADSNFAEEMSYGAEIVSSNTVTKNEETGAASISNPTSDLTADEPETFTQRLRVDAGKLSVKQMDIHYVRKGTAVVEHAKRSAQRFQQVKEELLMDDYVGGDAMPTASGQSLLDKEAVTRDDSDASKVSDEIVRVPTTEGLGNKQPIRQEPVQTSCVDTCIIL